VCSDHVTRIILLYFFLELTPIVTVGTAVGCSIYLSMKDYRGRNLENDKVYATVSKSEDGKVLLNPLKEMFTLNTLIELRQPSELIKISE
jgi:hypothetical protein